jgi:hypothetical protein
MRMWLAGLLLGAALAGLAPIAAAGASAGARKDTAWVPVKSLATNYQFGELPTRAKQAVVGRVKLDQITRVSSVVIHGKKTAGDLLVIRGKYQNLTGQRSYWTEGYAFTFGTQPFRCTLTVCGITPKGEWWQIKHAFGTPIVDYPAERAVPAHGTVAFREAIPLPPAEKSPPVRSLGDIWLLPIYAAFNYYEQPFPHEQLVRLSTYFAQTAIPRS